MRALEYAATFGFCVWLRAQEPSLARGGVAHDGEVATRLGLPAVPVCAETVALSTILILARETGARIHLCRLSSAEGVELVRTAKAQGMAVTCDVSANHVHLSEIDVGYFDANCNLVPPLRSLRDRDALRARPRRRHIDAICSDHTPVDDDAKQRPFAEAEPGATGLELLLPLTLKWAAGARSTPLPAALRKVTSAPLAVLGMPGGAWRRRAPADLCMFDPTAWWKVERGALHSQGKNTPFLGTGDGGESPLYPGRGAGCLRAERDLMLRAPRLLKANACEDRGLPEIRREPSLRALMPFAIEDHSHESIARFFRPAPLRGDPACPRHAGGGPAASPRTRPRWSSSPARTTCRPGTASSRRSTMPTSGCRAPGARSRI